MRLQKMRRVKYGMVFNGGCDKVVFVGWRGVQGSDKREIVGFGSTARKIDFAVIRANEISNGFSRFVNGGSRVSPITVNAAGVAIRACSSQVRQHSLEDSRLERRGRGMI